MMETTRLGASGILTSRLAYGCMRIFGDGSPESRRKGKEAVRAAMEEGYTLFDHADIYGGGKCEELFAEVLEENPGIRDRITITGKCGVVLKDKRGPGRYDLSRKHIVRAVESSLKRLGIDFLDLLLLHRPDYLLDAEEVSEVFQELRDSGKVAQFGVSNFRPSQVSLLRSVCPLPLLVNQVEINLHNLDAFTDGTLDQCQELDISPQSWCPLGGVAYPAWGNTLSKDDEVRIRSELDSQARKYEVEDWIVVLAWLLKHPAEIIPIIGSTRPSRIESAKRAFEIFYSREDWYRLMEARVGRPVP